MNTVTKTQAMDKIQEIESALESIAFYIGQQANTQQESEYITAEQARELVRNGGEAEYSFDNVVWYTCREDSSYRPLGIKYRAIKQAQPEPVKQVVDVDRVHPEWEFGSSPFKDWCGKWFGPDSDETYLAKAILSLPTKAQPEPVDNDTAFLKRFKENVLADVRRDLQSEPVALKCGGGHDGSDYCSWCGGAMWMNVPEVCPVRARDSLQKQKEKREVLAFGCQLESPVTPHCEKWCGLNGCSVSFKEPPKSEPSDPHAELRAEYAKQVKEGTVGFYLWEYMNPMCDFWQTCVVDPNWNPDNKYRYTDISCMVAKQGEPAKRMTRTEAQELYTENDDWWPNPFKGVDVPFSHPSTYAYTPKALKIVKWSDMPVGVMTNKGELRGVYLAGDNTCRICTESKHREDDRNWSRFIFIASGIELAPASEQPWMYWAGGECPVPEGCTFQVTCRSSAVREQEEVTDWTHTGHQGDIIAYRITGIAKGYVLEGAV